jgi:hypothetical protein
MNYFALRLAMGVAAGALGLAAASSLAANSGIDVLANRTYIHRDSKTSVRAPSGWTVQDPYRLRKTTNSSVLSLEKSDPRIAVTVVWSPLGKRPWREVIRAAEDENLGEEYGLLVAVYGKDKVSRPTTATLGGFTVYKILLDDGPDGAARSSGAVYLFEAGTGENRWKIKVRAVYPRLNREEHVKQVEELIRQFGYVQN